VIVVVSVNADYVMMSKIDTLPQTKFRGETIRVRSGDGTMFIIILENNRGLPISVQAHIGKGGSSVQAWCEGVVRMISFSLDRGATLREIIEELANITTDRIAATDGNVPIRSGVEGIVFALMKYQKGKRKRAMGALGL
jgi:hypothetical protein